MHDTRRDILSHISLFSIAQYLSEALFLIRGFLLARIFGPAFFGIWTEMKLALLFLQHARLGTNEAMVREVPYALGRGDAERANNIKNIVFRFNLLSAAFTGAGIFLFIILNRKIWNSDLRNPWGFFVLIFFISQIYWCINLKLQAEKRFDRISWMILGFALCSTVVGTLCAGLFSLTGFLIGLAFSYAVIVIYAGQDLPPLTGNGGSIPLLHELIKTGFPIMMSGALLILLWNVDKLIIWLLMSKEDLGIYAVQSYISNMVMLVPGAVSMVLYPRLMESFGKNQTPSKLERYLTQPTLIMSYLACPLIGILFMTLHLPIKWLLPKYLLAIVPGQILILAFFFMIIARMPATMLVSLNKQNLLLLLTGVSILIGAAADYILIRTGKGIIGVASGTFLSFVVYSVLTTAASLRAIKIPMKRSFFFLSLTVSPYAVVLFLLVVIFRLIPENHTGWGSDIIFTSIRCVMVTLPMGFVFYLINQRFSIVQQKA